MDANCVYVNYWSQIVFEYVFQKISIKFIIIIDVRFPRAAAHLSFCFPFRQCSLKYPFTG